MRSCFPLSVIVAAALAAAAGVGGCGQSGPPEPVDGQVIGAAAESSAESVRRIFARSAEEAVTVEHAVYPYHFTAGGASLNELGRRHLEVLAEAYAAGTSLPGELVVHRGDAPAAVYRARVQAVLDALAAAGADSGGLVVTDGLPGGDGMPSVDAAAALNEMRAGGGGRTGLNGSGGTGYGGTGYGGGGGTATGMGNGASAPAGMSHNSSGGGAR